jgi:peptide/nickel transport system substrate-binding protein
MREKIIMHGKTLAITLAVILGISMLLSMIPVFAAQPPVVTGTYTVGTIGQPRVVDPAVAYDTASGELIFNVYETLITYDGTSVKDFIGMIADQWWQSADRLTWTFHLRNYDVATHKSTLIKWHTWYDRSGSAHANEYVSLDDIEYSFKRAMVQDMSGGPEWMLYLPLTGTMGYGDFAPDKAAWIAAIDNSVTVNYAEGNVTFHLDFTFPTTAFEQILAQTWGSIVNKAFCIEYGSWNGTTNPDQAYAFRRTPIKNYSPLDSKQLAALAPWLATWPAGMPAPPVMCGTGPFIFSYWDKTRLEWKITRNDAYWGPNGVANFTEVYVKGVSEWSTRKMMFLAGEFDSVAVPRLNMLELLQGSPPTPSSDPLPGIVCIKDLPGLTMDNLFFIANVTEGSAYLGTGNFPGGIPYNFFANTDVRKAIAHMLNFTTLLAQGWYGEAIQPASWWVNGLEPNYENTTVPLYSEDLDAAEALFKSAMFTQGSETKSVWDWGFTLTMTYNLGNDQRKLVNDLVMGAFQELNARKGVGEPKFTVTSLGLDWPVILNYIIGMQMPMTQIGWLADFADADNWARPYMHSYGDWAYFQTLSEDPNWNATWVDEQIDKAVRLPEGNDRNNTYQALQSYYHDLVPSLPTVQALGRRWQRDWVQGYYYNVLGQGSLGNYFYIYWKAAAGAAKEVDIAAFNVAMSPANNITTYLIDQSYHLPKTGVAWMKTNYTIPAPNATVPIVSVTAYVAYYNGTPPSPPDVIVYLMWVGKTASNHTQEFGSAYALVHNGSSYTLGPKDVSKVMPTPGDYELYIYCFVLDPYAINVNVTKDYDAGRFKALGYCDTDGSMTVNMLDYQLVKKAVGSTVGTTKWNWSCDVDLNNAVNMLDYQKIKTKIPTVYP